MNEDVRLLVQILMDEGFDFLAGELLIEMAQADEAGPNGIEADDADTELHTKASLRQQAPSDDPLHEALDFIIERLVEPAEALVEAGEIGGRLSEGGSISFRFIDPERGEDVLPARKAGPDDRASIIRLRQALEAFRNTPGLHA